MVVVELDLARGRGQVPPSDGCGPGLYFLSGKSSYRHGVSVGQALHCGLLTTADFSALLAQCRACPQSAAAGVANGGGAPETCANRAVLEALRGLV